MKKRLLIIVFLSIGWAVAPSFAQNEMTLYNLSKHLPQGNQLNPAVFPNGVSYLGLPVFSGIHFSLANGFSMEDFYRKNSAGELVGDLNYLINNLGENNYLKQRLKFELGQLGVRVKDKAFFTIGFNTRVESDMKLPKEFFELLAYGNGDSRGMVQVRETIDLKDIQIRHLSFNEISAGIGFKVTKELQLGFKMKYLWGLTSVDTELHGSFLTDPDDYSLSLVLEGEPNFRTAGLLALTEDDESLYDDPAEYLLKNKNRGFSFDFGGLYRYGDKITFSASFIDLGYIHWKDDVKNQRLQTSYELGSHDLDKIFEIKNEFDGDYFDHLSDSLGDKFEPVAHSDAYTTWIKGRFYAGASYQYSKWFTFGATFTGATFRGTFDPGMNFYTTFHLGDFLHINANFGYQNEDQLTVGTGLVMNMGPVQMFMTTDNLFGAIKPETTQSVDFRFGLNLLFGRKKYRNKYLEKGKSKKRKEVPNSKGM